MFQVLMRRFNSITAQFVIKKVFTKGWLVRFFQALKDIARVWKLLHDFDESWISWCRSCPKVWSVAAANQSVGTKSGPKHKSSPNAAAQATLLSKPVFQMTFRKLRQSG